MNAEIRFQFVKLSLQTMSLTPKERNRLERANHIGLNFGILAAVGLFFVASFQVMIKMICRIGFVVVPRGCLSRLCGTIFSFHME